MINSYTAKDILKCFNDQINQIMNIKFHYNLKDIFSKCDFNSFDVLDEVINYYLSEIKKTNNKDVLNKCDLKISEISEFYDYSYFDDSDNLINLESEADDIANDLVMKLFEENDRNLSLPIKTSNIKEFCISNKIKNDEVYMVIWWIILKLSIIYHLSLKNEKED